MDSFANFLHSLLMLNMNEIFKSQAHCIKLKCQTCFRIQIARSLE